MPKLMHSHWQKLRHLGKLKTKGKQNYSQTLKEIETLRQKQKVKD